MVCSKRGNIDLDKVKACIAKEGADNIAYIRIEAGTNLIGGQPISYENMKEVTDLAKQHGIVTVLDASLLQDNLYFIKTREESMKDKSIREITKMIADLFDIIYFSARKFGFGRGGGIMVRDEAMFHAMEDYITMFEGFLTYGGMSVKEMEALIIGFEETMDMDIISQGPQFINHCVTELDKLGVPMVTPGGGLGGRRRAFRPGGRGRFYLYPLLCRFQPGGTAPGLCPGGAGLHPGGEPGGGAGLPNFAHRIQLPRRDPSGPGHCPQGECAVRRGTHRQPHGDRAPGAGGLGPDGGWGGRRGLRHPGRGGAGSDPGEGGLFQPEHQVRDGLQ